MVSKHAPRWSGNKLVKEIVLDAVMELTKGSTDIVFSPKQVSTHILEKYPNFKVSNVGPELAAGCPNLPSHRHFPVQERHKSYWWIKHGLYRLYDPESDKIGRYR